MVKKSCLVTLAPPLVAINLRVYLLGLFGYLILAPLAYSQKININLKKFHQVTSDATYIENAVAHLRQKQDYPAVYGASKAVNLLHEARQKGVAPDWNQIRQTSVTCRDNLQGVLQRSGTGKALSAEDAAIFKDFVTVLATVRGGAKSGMYTGLGSGAAIRGTEILIKDSYEYMAGSHYALAARQSRRVLRPVVELAREMVFDEKFKDQHPAAAETFDVLLSVPTNSSMHESAIEIAANNPKTVDPKIAGLAKEIETNPKYSQEEIEKELNRQTGELHQQIIQKTEKSVSKLKKKDRKTTPTRQETDQSIQAEIDTEIEFQTYEASFNILSKISAFALPDKPRLAGGIATLGRTALVIARTMNSLERIGKTLATLNIVGAIFDFISYLLSGPSIEEEILNHVVELRNQVDQMRHEMHDRFDRVDMGLDQIYQTMLESFDRVQADINANGRDLKRELKLIEGTLTKIQRDLGNLNSSVQAYFEANAQMPIIERLNRCHVHEDAVFGKNLSFEQFKDCLSAFMTCASDHSRNAIFSLPDRRFRAAGGKTLLPDEELFPQLVTQLEEPLERNASLLASIAYERFGNKDMLEIPNDASGRTALPNAALWSYCVSAYARTVLSYPEHYSRINASGADALLSAGYELQSTFSAITQSKGWPEKRTSGSVCAENKDCASNDCAAGPDALLYCKNAQKQCARPNHDGAVFGETFYFRRKFFLCAAGKGLVDSGFAELGDGRLCFENLQCKSGLCLPGPTGDAYCTSAEQNCARPNHAGAKLGQSYQFEGVLFKCAEEGLTELVLGLKAGELCRTSQECSSENCLRGPKGLSYCTAKEMNCAKPGAAGVKFGEVYQVDGVNQECIAEVGIVPVMYFNEETAATTTQAPFINSLLENYESKIELIKTEIRSRQKEYQDRDSTKLFGYNLLGGANQEALVPGEENLKRFLGFTDIPSAINEEGKVLFRDANGNPVLKRDRKLSLPTKDAEKLIQFVPKPFLLLSQLVHPKTKVPYGKLVFTWQPWVNPAFDFQKREMPSVDGILIQGHFVIGDGATTEKDLWIFSRVVTHPTPYKDRVDQVQVEGKVHKLGGEEVISFRSGWLWEGFDAGAVGGLNQLPLKTVFVERSKEYTEMDPWPEGPTFPKQARDGFVEFQKLHKERCSKDLVRARHLIETAFLAHRIALSDEIRTGLATQGDSLALASGQLGGAKELIKAYLSLGAPFTNASDDAIRAMLYGNQSLFTGESLLQLIASLGAESDFALSLGHSSLLNERVQLLKKAFSERFDSQFVSESQPLIEDTLSLLMGAKLAHPKAGTGLP